ncbi:MAG: hypothetical protein K0S61_3529 [Anaerocolumna sp.]|jgi:hypothetical protein|nr:hypothetical protein [Anaerocolumna sp.]
MYKNCLIKGEIMIYVNLISISFIVLFFVISKNYNIEETKNLDYKTHPLKRLYPLGLFIMDKLSNKTFAQSAYTSADKVEEALAALHVGEKAHTLQRLYQCKKIVLVIAIFFVTNILSLLTYLNESNNKELLLEGKYLNRAQHGEGSTSANLHFRISNEKAILLEENIELEINEREFTLEEINQLLKEGSKYIDSVILLDNQDANTIRSDLSFPASIPSNGIKITWFTEDKDVIGNKGQVYNDQLDSTKLLWVRAILELKDRKATYSRYFKVYPREYTPKEFLQKQLFAEIEKSDKETITQNSLELPSKVGDENITWTIVSEKQVGGLFILGILAASLIYFFMDRDLWTKVDKRNEEMLLDYPDIINKFTLLVGAGMSLSNAWSKIARDYSEEAGPYKYAYEEMNITARELSVGVSEITAYEGFGRRVKLLPYLRFSSFLARNVKKGSKDLLELLEFESLEAFEERKELAKRLGEEAGTKLLLPMMLMLIIVLGIILVPAFLSFQF